MMMSSVLKSLALGTVLMMSRASAEILNWDINFLSVNPDFDNGTTNEVILKYEIGKGRDEYQVDFFNENCIGPIDENTVATVVSTTSTDTNHDTLEILMDLNKKTIVSSNIWTKLNSKLKFCVRVKLLSGDTVINEDSRNFNIDFEFKVNFDANEDVKFQQDNIASESGTATVNDYIEACTCYNATSFECNANPISPSSILNICIKSLSDEMNIFDIDSLLLTQGSNELKLYDGSEIQNDAITSETEVPDHNGVLVSSIIPSQFFSYASSTTAQMSGKVNLRLPGTRRLAVKITGHPKVIATGSTRALNSRFGDQPAASTFVIDLELEKKELGDANAANVQSGFLTLSYVVSVITVIAMML